MRIEAMAVLMALSLISTNFAWAQTLPPSTSLTVEILPAYSYRADDGSTVVLGEVVNHNGFPVTDVKIGVTFQDDNDNSLEYKTGTTLLKVVPPYGKAPFSIVSSKPDPTITKVSTKIAGFISSSSKQQSLTITLGLLQIASDLKLSGTIKNDGAITSTGTKIYLISYDAFQRVVGISQPTPESIDINAGSVASFIITAVPNGHARSYKIVAESDIYQSTLTDVTNISAVLPIIIGKTLVTDPQGSKYTAIPIGSSVKITSDLRYLGDQATQSYLYYVQIKNFAGQVEFIGSSEGIFLGTNQNSTVTWNPEIQGPYFIETYVWDSNNVPLASPGHIINVVLVKSQQS